jgi:hypothetical protein
MATFDVPLDVDFEKPLEKPFEKPLEKPFEEFFARRTLEATLAGWAEGEGEVFVEFRPLIRDFFWIAMVFSPMFDF